MKKIQLNIEALKRVMLDRAKSQKDIAKTLGISSQAVSDWFTSKKMPEPLNLKSMCDYLNISITDAIISRNDNAYSFKLPANTTMSEVHRKRAEDIGGCLEALLPFVESEIINIPDKLANPKIEYEYIKKTAIKITQELNPHDGIIDVNSIIDYISEKLNTTIVPVFWGEKKQFADGLQYSFKNCGFLYINLNSKEDDFKFWLLHESAHLLAPDMDENSKEIFANKLAAEILFPEKLVLNFLDELKDNTDETLTIDNLFFKAKQLGIHPYTIFKQLSGYVEMHGGNFSLDSSDIYDNTDNFETRHISGKTRLSAREYINITKSRYRSKFFDYLSDYLKSAPESNYQFVARVLQTDLQDALEIYQAVKNER